MTGGFEGFLGEAIHLNLAYSDLAAMRMGMSGSASLQNGILRGVGASF